MMYERTRLHPASIVVTVLKHLREFFFPLIIFVVVGFRDGGIFSFIFYGALLVLVTALIGYSVAVWYRFYYWIEEEELRIESGVFVKKRRFIPQERIQTIDTSEGIIQRIFGLVKVQVETAGGGTEAEAVLSAVTKDEAQRLRNALLYKEASVLSEVEQDTMIDERIISKEKDEVRPTYTISWKYLFVVGTTSGGIGVVLSAVVAFASQFDQFIPYEDVVDRFGLVLQTSVYFIASIVFLVLLLSWLISIAMTMFKYGNFTVVKQGDELLISRGIIEKRQLTIPLARIQAIRISQNLLRQPFGLATVYVEIAGGAGGKEADFATILFPLVKMKEIKRLMKEFTPAYSMQQLTHVLPKRSLIRYMLRLVVPAILVSSTVTYLFQPYGSFSFILVGIAIALAYGQFKAGGWDITGSQLQLSYRFVNKNIVMIHKKRVQSFEWKESRFQRRQALQTINAAIKSSISSKNFRVADVERQDGHEIFNWYTHQKSKIN
ncbi:PH domain-containing protein [Sutcliffiella halmapala]|uniref:PH domain-containing protein n=1 Tax=Sutcliffiella halmapala TaxID=79882 RepID=UPI000994C884|nr:PH domain-containing protein [Sutcliffiella halmapala]